MWVSTTRAPLRLTPHSTQTPCLEYCDSLRPSTSLLDHNQHALSACSPRSSQSDPIQTCVSHGIPLLRTLPWSPTHTEKSKILTLACITPHDLPPSHVQDLTSLFQLSSSLPFLRALLPRHRVWTHRCVTHLPLNNVAVNSCVTYSWPSESQVPPCLWIHPAVSHGVLEYLLLKKICV